MNNPTRKEQLTTAIMPGDYVKHNPSGEKWVVCGVNYEQGKLVPVGYPFPALANIADCTLVEKRYDKDGQDLEFIKALKKAGLPSFIDEPSVMLYHVLFNVLGDI